MIDSILRTNINRDFILIRCNYFNIPNKDRIILHLYFNKLIFHANLYVTGKYISTSFCVVYGKLRFKNPLRPILCIFILNLFLCSYNTQLFHFKMHNNTHLNIFITVKYKPLSRILRKLPTIFREDYNILTSFHFNG